MTFPASPSCLRHGPGLPGLDLRLDLLGRTFTEVENRVGLLSHPRSPTVPGVSWRPQPARAATRRPGRTSDGRKGAEARRNSDGRDGNSDARRTSDGRDSTRTREARPENTPKRSRRQGRRVGADRVLGDDQRRHEGEGHPVRAGHRDVGAEDAVDQPGAVPRPKMKSQAAERSRAWRVRRVRTTWGRKLSVVQVPAKSPSAVIGLTGLPIVVCLRRFVHRLYKRYHESVAANGDGRRSAAGLSAGRSPSSTSQAAR